MSTTASGFVKNTNAVLVNATVGAAGAMNAMNGLNATQLDAAGNVTRVDRYVTDLATAGYAKNGAFSITLSGTTPATISFLDTTTGTTVSAGDTAFGTLNLVHVYNTGAADITIAPGASNPAPLGFAGTTPALTVPAGGHVVIVNPAGGTVDSTHKNILITPTAGGSVAVSAGGA